MRLVFALAFASLAVGAPLVPLEGRPGELVTLLFGGEGEMELPAGFALVIPPEVLDGKTLAVVRVPSLPAGEYPLRFGEEAYTFKVLPVERVDLIPPLPREVGQGEEVEIAFRVRNLGNVPTAPKFQAVALGARLVRLRPLSRPLAPGEEGEVRLRVRGDGREARVLLRALGVQSEVKLLPRPAPLPPFHDWATLPSWLRWDSAQGLSLEGRGPVLDPLGRPLGQLSFGLRPSALVLDFATPIYGVGLNLSQTASGFSLRYTPAPFAFSLSGDSGGRFSLRGSYAEGGLRLAVEALRPWSYALEAGYTGGGFGLQARLTPSALDVNASASVSPLVLTGGFSTPGGAYVQGVLPLGAGVNAGLGYRFGQGRTLLALLGLPVLGTVEGRAEYGLDTGLWRFHFFHVLGQEESLEAPFHLTRFYERLSLAPEGWAYGLGLKGSLEGVGLEGGIDLSPQGGQARLQAAWEGLALGGSASFAWGRGVTGFGLSGSLAFSMPLYPLAYPTLRIKGMGLEGPLTLAGPGGSFLLPLVEGVGEVRLPPGTYRLLAPKGRAFLQGGRLAREVAVDLKESLTLRLQAVQVLEAAFAFRYCPPEPRPGWVAGIPGVAPEAVLAQTRLRVEGDGLRVVLRQGEWTLLPPGRYRLGLEGPFAGRLEVDPAFWEAKEGVWEVCLVPPARPLEEWELRLP